jgi:hypothetical protein
MYNRESAVYLDYRILASDILVIEPDLTVDGSTGE